MGDSDTIYSCNEQLKDDGSSPCRGIENVSIIVNKRWKKLKKRKVKDHAKQPTLIFHLTRCTNQGLGISRSSMPELSKRNRSARARNRSRHGMDKKNKFKQSPFQSKYIANIVSEHRFDSCFFTSFNFPSQTKWKIYRCQLSTAEESCCCSCNSDAMFEVMKGLYDCYKKKNCDNCHCILCSHLPRDERMLGEIRKSMASVARENILDGKTAEDKEKILDEMAKKGIPLPEGKTASDKALIAKKRKQLGLPPAPETAAEKEKMKKAALAGLLTPLEGKTAAQKEKKLRAQAALGLPLPEGRTDSEKAMIAKIGALPASLKASGLLSPLKGKPPEEKERILRGLAAKGVLLPEGKTESEKKLIDKVRADLGLPPEPKTKAMRDKHQKAAKAGLLQPLEGKTPAEKEKILKGLHDMGIDLPEGRTASEKSLIAKISAMPPEPSIKTAGLKTPLKGKTPEQKEKILRGLAKRGLPFPEAQTPSEKKLSDKVRAELGLPPEPKSKSIRDKHEKAAKAGLLQPLEGKTPAEKERILKGLHDMGIPLPEGRTPSEKSLINKVMAMPREPAEVITSLKGKTPEEKEKILRGLAESGLPLPEPLTPSEKKLNDKVRADLGLPPEPKTKSIRSRHEKAAKAGLLQPLEGKSPAEKEKILKGLHDMGIPLPEGRTPSEKYLINKVMAMPREPVEVITPLKGKTPEEKEKILRGLAESGLPLPEGDTASEKKLINKVRADLGLPPEPATKSIRGRHEQAAKMGLLQPLEGKTPEEKEKILKGLHDMGIPLPEGRTPSEKAIVAKVKAMPRAPSIKTAGLLTPLKGKSPEQKETILRGLAAKNLPLPEAQTPSEKKLIDKVRTDLGLPPDPTTKSMRGKHEKAAKAGLLQPLEGKTPEEKERILKGLHDMGIPLPEGRTPSEKAIVAKVKGMPKALSIKTAGLLTPLRGKTPEQKEKILRGLAAKNLPLPEAQTPSEKKLIDKVRADLGLPPDPTTKSMRDKHEKAAKAGLLQPLEGKSPAEKERILNGLQDMGIPLPEGRTPSEKALIAKVSAKPREPSLKTVGLQTPLKGKPPEQKEKILRGLAKRGLPLPEAQTPSDKKLTDKIRAELGLPPEPKTKSIRDKHEKAAKAGLLQPLEGKTPAEKEKILRGLQDMGIPLPEGRTPSEKSLIAKISGKPREPTIKTASLLTPLEGKTPEQKEKILRGLAKRGLPLPEAITPSEKKLIDKVRADLGLPPDPTKKSMRDKHEKAAKTGLLQPLEGKTPAEKEKILKGLHDMGIPLPEGRTPSEKALIASIAAMPRELSIKTAGLTTPLKGKTPEQKEKILRGLAKRGLPLPEAQTPSDKKLTDKIRAELGLPPEPKSKSIRDKHEKAAKAGLLQPLEGKTPAEKEKILRGLQEMGIPLPEGRTPSEKSLIAKISGKPREPTMKTASLLTPLEGKTPEQKEKILRGLAKRGLPLPEAQTPSEKKLIDKVRANLGLPPDPTTKSMRDKHEKAAKTGLLQPLEGKTPAEKEKILKGLHDMGIPLPEGRTPSEKALIASIGAMPREVSIKTAGLLTPLQGKTPEQKEKILRGLAKRGLPLPEAQTPSDKKLTDKIRAELGLPPEPKTKSIRDKHEKAAKAGILQPLEGKTPAEKERILRGLQDMGIPLPEGRTPSEKALIANISGKPREPTIKTAGLLTPLEGKTPERKEKILRGLAKRGLPLPEAQTPSDKKLTDKIRAELGLPPEPKTKSIRDKHEKAAKAGLLQPLEGKTPAEKEKILKGLRDLGIPLPEGRTPSEKALIASIAAMPRELSIKTTGLLTPLQGKTPEQKEKILRGLAKKGLPLPEAQTPSDKKLTDKIRAELGLPPEPKTKSIRDKHEKAAKAGLLQPLEGKTPAEKEKILKGLRDLGIPLPEGRTPSEKALIASIAAMPRELSIKTAGLLTPLQGKTPEQKEKILRGLAKKGLPLPEAQTPSDKKLTDKIRAELGLPPEPKTKSIRDKHEKAAKAGLLQPLEGKTPAEKERILNGLQDMGIPLPEGRTPSEKALIAKISGKPREPTIKTAGLLTPLEGKTPEQKEKILRGLAKKGLPLPEAQTPSDKKLTDKIRAELGLPPEPKTKSIRDKHEKAAKAGLLQPLEGKTPAEKERILNGLQDMGIPLPEGRTPSEKALIAKISGKPREPTIKTAGLLTPLEGKTPEQKEKILRGLAKKGLPLPEAITPSEKKLADKVRAELGLPPEPKTKSIRDKHEKAAKAGLLQPLEGKTPAEKEKILKGLHDMGIPLPEGRTPSEKALIAQIEASPKAAKSLPSITTEKLRKAKAAGLLTPLAGKTPEEKEKILRGLVDTGLPLPDGKTPSEKALINKIKKESGLAEKTPSEKLRRAKAAGLLTPLEGKTPAQREKILRGRAAAGLPLPVGKTPSERALVQKIKEDTGFVTPSPSERLRKAKAAGLITPLKGKSPSMKEKILKDMKAAGVPIPEGETPSEKSLIRKLITRPPSLELTPTEKLKAAKTAGLMTPLEGKTPAEKEKILEGLAQAGLPLPEGKTKSEKSMIARIKARTPPIATTPSEKSVVRKAKVAGLFTPITGKTPEQKEKILRGLAEAGLPLPEGRTPSEKALVQKIRAEQGLPLEATPSEKKGKIRKKAKKVGVSASKKGEGIEAQEFEDIIKKDKCDRGCGCDKKKIRFKHSYVKIRVTSPDMSSLCDCDYECLPGIKTGAFIDNEGIKVTVGSAIGIPSYSTESLNRKLLNKSLSNIFSKSQTNYLNCTRNLLFKVDSLDLGFNDIHKDNYVLNTNSSNISYSTKLRSPKSENIDVPRSTHFQDRTSKYNRVVRNLRGFQSLDNFYKGPSSRNSSASSFDTIIIIKNDMSLSTSTSNSMDTISLLSFVDSNITCSSAQYSGYQSTNDLPSINSLDGPYTSDDLISNFTSIGERKMERNIGAVIPQHYTVFDMSPLELNFGYNKIGNIKENGKNEDSVVFFKHLPSNVDVSKLMLKIMSKKRFSDASSIFIVVPTSGDEAEASSNCISDTSVQSSACNSTANTTARENPDAALRTSSFVRHDVQVCGKGEKFYMEEILSDETESVFQNECLGILQRGERAQNKYCQINTPNEVVQILEKAVQGVDIDVNFVCSPKESSNTQSIENGSKNDSPLGVISRLLAPLFSKDKSDSRMSINSASTSVPTCDVALSVCPHRNQENQTQETLSASQDNKKVAKEQSAVKQPLQRESMESLSRRAKKTDQIPESFRSCVCPKPGDTQTQVNKKRSPVKRSTGHKKHDEALLVSQTSESSGPFGGDDNNGGGNDDKDMTITKKTSTEVQKPIQLANGKCRPPHAKAGLRRPRNPSVQIQKPSMTSLGSAVFSTLANAARRPGRSHVRGTGSSFATNIRSCGTSACFEYMSDTSSSEYRSKSKIYGDEKCSVACETVKKKKGNKEKCTKSECQKDARGKHKHKTRTKCPCPTPSNMSQIGATSTTEQKKEKGGKAVCDCNKSCKETNEGDSCCVCNEPKPATTNKTREGTITEDPGKCFSVGTDSTVPETEKRKEHKSKKKSRVKCPCPKSQLEISENEIKKEKGHDDDVEVECECKKSSKKTKRNPKCDCNKKSETKTQGTITELKCSDIQIRDRKKSSESLECKKETKRKKANMKVIDKPCKPTTNISKTKKKKKEVCECKDDRLNSQEASCWDLMTTEDKCGCEKGNPICLKILRSDTGIINRESCLPAEKKNEEKTDKMISTDQLTYGQQFPSCHEYSTVGRKNDKLIGAAVTCKQTCGDADEIELDSETQNDQQFPPMQLKLQSKYIYKELDPEEIRQKREQISKLTMSTSGFKVSKRKQVGDKNDLNYETQLSFGEAIRYFASMNPELFRNLMQDEIERQLNAEEIKCKGKESKKLRKKIKKEKKEKEKAQKIAVKEAKKGKTTIDNRKDDFFCPSIPDDETEYTCDPASDYPIGFKFKKSAKPSMECCVMTRKSSCSEPSCCFK